MVNKIHNIPKRYLIILLCILSKDIYVTMNQAFYSILTYTLWLIPYDIDIEIVINYFWIRYGNSAMTAVSLYSIQIHVLGIRS